MKILLTGYYGFGNFGDDLLFISNYNLIQKLYPSARIDIYTEATEPEYLEKLLNKPLLFLNYTSSGTYDYIWHGGGGVFFDFKQGSLTSFFLNSFIKLFGVAFYSRLYDNYRRLRNMPVILFKSRIGFGLGLGGFTRSSARYREAVYKLNRFSLMIVRDQRSAQLAKKLSPRAIIVKSTDIVFDTSLWLPQNIYASTERNHDRKIGIVLRDWLMPDGYNYLPDILEISDALAEKGYNLQCFAFDASTDKEFIKNFENKGYKVNIWQPQTESLNEYLSKLGAMNYLLSSRFHGAITGACLGIPGACIEIEHKLKSAVKMLNGSYSLVSLPAQPKRVIELIEEDFLNLEEKGKCASKAVKENWDLLQSAYPILKKELHG